VSVVVGPWVVGGFERRLGEALAHHSAAARALLEVRCGGCDGAGAVLDPDWADFHVREWDARVVFERAHPDGPPWVGSGELARLRAKRLRLPREEESPCLECSGAGSVPTETRRLMLVEEGA